MNCCLRVFSLTIFGALLLEGACFGEVTPKHRDLAQSVLNRLLEKMDRISHEARKSVRLAESA